MTLGVCALAWGAGAAAAQSGPSTSDPWSDYFRILEIAGLRPLGSSFVNPSPAAASLWHGVPEGRHLWAGPRSGAEALVRVRPTGARLRGSVNTGHPFGWNDGALWQGKGLSGGMDAGVEFRWRAVVARLHPEVTWAQNTAFDVEPAAWGEVPEFAYPWRVIDLPQRQGTSGRSDVWLGDSEVRVDTGPVALGVSTRNRWWGPGVRNAILMSDNAPGIPHAFVSTGRRIDLGFGKLEAFYLYGRLKQSDWFDESLRGNERFLTGLVVGVEPDWPRGLSLGGARAFYGRVPESGHVVSDALLPFQGVRKKRRVTPDDPLGDDEEDQLLSLFMRWALPESGFEVYVEWARTDHSWDFRDFILEPEHSQGRTLGLRHASDLGDGRLLVLGLEVTDVSRTPTSQVRDNPTYYEHWIVTQGYTHHGQIIGAGVGPGGSTQSVTADLYHRRGRAGLVLERRVHDNDAYYYHAARSEAEWCCHDVSFSAGPRAVLFRNDMELEVRSLLTRELNRYFRRGHDVWNIHVGISARWRPR